MTNETTASQPKSIGDDAQFLKLIADLKSAEGRDAEWIAVKEVTQYLDSKLRAPAAQASATIQAAPVGWRDKLRWSKANTDYHGLTAFTPDQLEHFVSMLCAPAATIEEPVMVAEPVGAFKIGGFTVKEDASLAPSEYKIAQAAAPMAADPAGVARFDFDEWFDEHSMGVQLRLSKEFDEFKSAVHIHYSQAATVKAVPSEAPTVAEMVNRFLGWKLPSTFQPDAGISFDRSYAERWDMPSGTNLLSADQAKAMFEFVLATPMAGKTGGGEG